MADAHHNTQNPSGADLSHRALTGRDLEIFIEPLLSATRILAMLKTDQMEGVGAADAYEWLAHFAHARAHELQAFVSGHQPEFRTDLEAEWRAKAFAGLPCYQEWLRPRE